MFELIFIQNAIVAALLVSITAGIIGAIIVANRLVFISGGIAHTAYGGVGMGYYFGISPFAGALLFTIPASLIMAWMQSRLKERAGTLIGLFWASGMAIGVVFLDLTPGYKPDLMSFLFGSIITVPVAELKIMFSLNLLIIIIVFMFYKQILSFSIDPEFAASRTLPVLFIKMLVFSLIAISVVIVMRSTGLILMIALFTVPAGIINKWAKNLYSLMAYSMLLAVFLCMSGLVMAWVLNISSGASIILVSTVAYLINLSLFKIKPGKSPNHLLK